MGIYDRDYYRDQPRGVQLSTQTGVFLLVAANVTAFIVNYFTQAKANSHAGWLNAHGALGADVFRSWQLWELVTHGFLHGGVLHLVFNMLALWWFGKEVEAIYGRKRFLQMYFTFLIGAGLGWVAAQTLGARDFSAHLVGASGAIAGVLIVFVLHYPARLILIWGVIPAPAWLMATIWVLQDLYWLTNRMEFARPAVGAPPAPNVGFAAHLTGAALGAIFYYLPWTPLDLISFSWWNKFSARSLKKRFAAAAQPRLRVVEPEDEVPEDLEAEVDRILAKISQQGTASLTADEQRTLQRAAERAKQRLRS